MVQTITALLNSLSPFAWPALMLYIFVNMRREIKVLVSRLRRGKFMGQEIELGEALEQLEENVSAVVESAPALPTGSQSEASYRERILAEADVSALGAFLRVSSDLEIAVNQVLARAGWHDGRRKMSVREGFSRMPSKWIGRDFSKSVDLFTQLRNKIVHESRHVTDSEIQRAIDIGLILLDSLKNLPLEEVRVKDVVDVYADSETINKFVGLKGLRVICSYRDQLETMKVFPTTKTWYEPGQLLTSEWDKNVIHAPAFYRDPDDNIVKPAWVSSNEFVGRPVEKVLD